MLKQTKRKLQNVSDQVFVLPTNLKTSNPVRIYAACVPVTILQNSKVFKRVYFIPNTQPTINDRNSVIKFIDFFFIAVLPPLLPVNVLIGARGMTIKPLSHSI